MNFDVNPGKKVQENAGANLSEWDWAGLISPARNGNGALFDIAQTLRTLLAALA
jgi:hypothetical protein